MEEGLLPRVDENGLDQVLTIIERAPHRQVVDVRRSDGGHLPPLDIRYPALGMQHDDLYRIEIPQSVDRRRSRVTGSRPDHRDPLSPALQHLVQ